MASNAAAASKAAEEKKAAKAAAPGLLGDCRALGYVNPFTLNAQLKGWLEAGKAEVALKGLWHKAKPRGAYIQRVQDAGPTGTLPCFAHACFCVMHSLYSLLIQLKVHTGTKLGKFNGELALASSMRTVLIKTKERPR